MTLADLIGLWHEGYHIEDDSPLLVTLATAKSNGLSGDLVWLMLVGAPSTIKSETIRSLGREPDDMVFPLSTLTANTFISGQSKKAGLLQRLDGKILLVKDLTTILEKNKDARNEILGQLREIYDGYLSKASGNEGAEYQNVAAKVTIIAGVTIVIDLQAYTMSILGERFLKVRVTSGDPKKLSKKTRDATGKEDTIREIIHWATRRFLKGTEVYQFELTDKQSERIMELAEFVAKARTGIARDWRGTIEYLPQPEGPARLYKQLQKLGWCLAAILGRETLDDDIMTMLARVARDTVDARRTLVLDHVPTSPEVTSLIAERIGLPTDTARRLLEDLRMLGFVTKGGNESKGYNWALSDESMIATKRYPKCTQPFVLEIGYVDRSQPDERDEQVELQKPGRVTLSDFQHKSESGEDGNPATISDFQHKPDAPEPVIPAAGDSYAQDGPCQSGGSDIPTSEAGLT